MHLQGCQLAFQSRDFIGVLLHQLWRRVPELPLLRPQGLHASLQRLVPGQRPTDTKKWTHQQDALHPVHCTMTGTWRGNVRAPSQLCICVQLLWRSTAGHADWEIMQPGWDSPPPPLLHVLIGGVGGSASLVCSIPQLRHSLLIPALDLLQRLICIRFCLTQLLPQLPHATHSQLKLLQDQNPHCFNIAGAPPAREFSAAVQVMLPFELQQGGCGKHRLDFLLGLLGSCPGLCKVCVGGRFNGVPDGSQLGLLALQQGVGPRLQISDLSRHSMGPACTAVSHIVLSGKNCSR